MKVAGGEVTEAIATAAGAPAVADRAAAANTPRLPALCRVTATVSAAPGSAIKVAVWLPEQGGWKGDFLGTGNGGFAGAITTGALVNGVRLGYATANTDMGTAAAGGNYDNGFGQAEMIKDWGWRSTHAMTEVGKEITRAYYGAPITRSLFLGCSTGGHQGLMTAQRYPEDYDGIVAGAAGNYRIGLHLSFLYYARVSFDHPDRWISPDQVKAIHARVVAQCAGKGGGHPSDGFVSNPAACDFRAASLACKPGQATASCLTAPQLAMLQQAYNGIDNPRTGKTIYPGAAPGGEVGILVRLLKSGANLPKTSSLITWVKGPDFNSATFDFDRDVEALFRAWGADINAVSPDLSAFQKRGGKLITFHGWEDTVVSPYDSINYLERVKDADAFMRLFMLPGVSHCQSGPGPDSIGNTAVEGETLDADHNLVLALDRWIATGQAPERLIATKWAGLPSPRPPAAAEGAAPAPPPSVVATRPICAYPKIARFQSGDPGKAESYACAAGPKAKYKPPASEYLTNSGSFGS